MRYTESVIIRRPIDTVVKMFDNPDNMKHWMDGLQSFEHISGSPGQVGAVSRLRFKMGKRDMDMIERITVRDLPHEFSGTYEVQGVFNIVRNYFEEIGPNQTKVSNDQEFQFKGFMKIMNLMPWMFKKQSRKYLEAFKKFVEGNS